MFGVYVFCLVLGAGLAMISIFSDVLGGGGVELDVDVDLDVDLDLDVDAGVDGGAGGGSGWSKIFSIRGLVYFVFGFGLTGTVLMSLLGSASTATLPLAIVTGLVAGTVVSRLVGYLKSSGSGVVQGEHAWEGHTGVVTLPMGVGSPGKVRVSRGEREVVLRALPHGSVQSAVVESEDALIVAPEGWKNVMVVEVVDGVAYVVPTDDDGTPIN